MNTTGRHKLFTQSQASNASKYSCLRLNGSAVWLRRLFAILPFEMCQPELREFTHTGTSTLATHTHMPRALFILSDARRHEATRATNAVLCPWTVNTLSTRTYSIIINKPILQRHIYTCRGCCEFVFFLFVNFHHASLSLSTLILIEWSIANYNIVYVSPYAIESRWRCVLLYMLHFFCTPFCRSPFQAAHW